MPGGVIEVKKMKTITLEIEDNMTIMSMTLVGSSIDNGTITMNTFTHAFTTMDGETVRVEKVGDRVYEAMEYDAEGKRLR